MSYQEQRLSAKAVSTPANLVQQPEAKLPGPLSLREKCPFTEALQQLSTFQRANTPIKSGGLGPKLINLVMLCIKISLAIHSTHNHKDRGLIRLFRKLSRLGRG